MHPIIGIGSLKNYDDIFTDGFLYPVELGQKLCSLYRVAIYSGSGSGDWSQHTGRYQYQHRTTLDFSSHLFYASIGAL